MLTVGQILQKKRKEKGITLEKAQADTRIRIRYLEALEKDTWSLFSSRVYIAGVIRTYASYLGIRPEDALAYFRRDYEKKEDTTSFKRKLPSLQFLPETKKILIGLLSLVFIFFAVYFGYQFNAYLSPPPIQIISPRQTTFRNVEKITIVGKTAPQSTVSIFNDQLFPDAEGRFRYEFPLHPGKNILTIEVVGANGKKSLITQEYVLE